MEHRLGREFSERIKSFKKWELIILLAIVVLLFGGIVVYAEADRIQLQRICHEVKDSIAKEKDTPVLGAPEGVVPLFQDTLSGCKVAEIDGVHPAGSARRAGCDYFVSDGAVSQEELADTGYQLVSRKGDYHFYASEIKAGEWRITQYGTVSGLQSMCYSLVSADGSFLLVDGGHEVDQEGLRRLIEVFGNRVDLWICSHFHEDHIGAITAMLPELGEIEIGEIWYPPMDIETYKTFAKDWDCVDTCEKFLEEAAGLENARQVEIGECPVYEGLSFEFLTAYTKDAPWAQEGNNCGFMFQVNGMHEKMLFCCDIGGEWISEVLINSYGDRLKSDYVQMGHHGNGGLTEEAYRIVAPQAAFFDSPAWLFADEEKYTTAKNRRLMESLGCTVYVLDEAPNSVILK